MTGGVNKECGHCASSEAVWFGERNCTKGLIEKLSTLRVQVTADEGTRIDDATMPL
jgi:hypothetical protein